MTKIKICGLFREEDITYVNQAKPDYIGFILNFKKSHRYIEAEDACVLRSKLDPKIKAVGVFVNEEIDELLRITETVKLDVIQLHGQETNDYINDLRKKTNLPIWKAFKVKDEASLKEAEKSVADKVILDNGYGTGECFDWSVLKSFKRSFILAGGLKPENLKEAIKTYKPECLDISSGVETGKIKDKEKILTAVSIARE